MLAWYTVPYWNWKVALVMDTAEIQAPAVQQRNVMLGLGLGAIVLLVAVSLLALEKIAIRPLRQLQAYAGTVADGDLNARLDLRLKNEIGKLADALRTMVENLKAKIAEADENTRKAQAESERAAQATAEAEAARAAAERASIIRLRSSSRTLRRIRSTPCRQTSRSICLRTRRPRPRNGNSVCRRWANRCAGRCSCSVLRARISPSAVRMGSATC